LTLVDNDSKGLITFFRLPGKSSAGLVVEPPVEVQRHQLAVRRRDVEALRTQIAALHQMSMQNGVQPTTPEPTKDLQALLTAQDSIARRRYANRKLTALAKHYMADLVGRGLKQDELSRQEAACSALIEMTADMPLGEIDREDIELAIQRLAGLPHRRDLVRRKDKTMTWTQLIEKAAEENLPRITPSSLSRLVEDMTSMFGHGHREGWLRSNPMSGLARKTTRQSGEDKADHERRDPFNDDELNLIFSEAWFTSGVGKRTKQGLFHRYRSYYYWLPLLGLFTGGRINELSQLYLTDVRQTNLGTWFLDFNLDQPDKLDTDESDVVDAGSAATSGTAASHKNDKSLKTANARRSVPLHSRLLELGFIEYVKALTNARHQRLFPELRFSKGKGYGKEASSWFCERLLGEKLKMVRDGRKVFHSLRHNFATSLERAGVPDRAIRQLMGHELSSDRTHTAPGYQHARTVGELKPHIEALSPILPTIAKFDIPSGLQAVNDALAYKARQPKARKQARS
jgi:integrase